MARSIHASDGPAPSRRKDKAFARLVCVAFVAATASKAFVSPNDDGFPLSTYPMFSRNRVRHVDVAHVVAIDHLGHATPVPPRLVANDEVMQAAMTVRRALRSGPGSALSLCQAIARRMAEHDPERASAVVRLEVRTSRFDAIDYFSTSTKPLETAVGATCELSVPNERVEKVRS